MRHEPIESNLRFGDFTLDVAKRRLERGDVEVPLQPKVFDTLRYLVEHRERVVSRDELLSQLWPDTVVGDAALTRCVKEVRRALDDDPRAPRFVRTIPSVGYRFAADVERTATEHRSGRVRVLAVLPFRPLRADERDPGLELGMADALITRLAGLRALVVRPLSTVRRFIELDQDPVAAGRELGVDAVVDGSLQRQGDRIRVSARVLTCSDGRALFAAHYDELLRDVFHLQDAVCRRIVAAISHELDAAEAERVPKPDTEDLRAYRHFLRGRLGLGRMIPADALRAIEHFEKALALDPDYAQALVSLAEANIVLAWQGVEPVRYYGEARAAAERALRLDPRLGSAWSCLGTVAWEHDWDWNESDRRFQRAVELAPNVVDVWGRYSASCAFSGRHEQAVELARRAVDVDRNSPMAGAWLAQALHMAGRSEEAIEVGESVVARSPDAPFALLIVGIASLHLGRLEAAIDALEQAAATGRPDFLAVLAHAYLRAGQEEEATAVEASLLERSPSGAAPPFARAMIHAARDDVDGFFEAMAEAFDQPSLHAVLIAGEPLFERYRADPRAAALIERLGLPGG
ncbi:MAG TPA: winged helix-turn-helix domain-containing protein [Thermoanaerobaculia bacterium]|nr:winged helix-turn-helix domain-containing protein [Thermoanaerobaculia bacterium]